MHPLPRQVGCVLAVATAVALVGGCSKAGANRPPAASSAAAKQRYLASVNALCDQLLPQVIQATHGGSIDIPASQYLADWPAHAKLLAGFDTSLAAIPVPAGATAAAAAMRGYVKYADRLDAARLTAAKRGEQAWRAEVAAEKGAVSDPAIAARSAARFAASCDAR